MKITCHMIMSVDGRLLPKYWSPLYNASSSVTEVYEAADAKLSADGWIVGRKTMAEYGADVRRRKKNRWKATRPCRRIRSSVNAKAGRLPSYSISKAASTTNLRHFPAANISLPFSEVTSLVLIRKNWKKSAFPTSCALPVPNLKKHRVPSNTSNTISM